jgi:hypothetical protein
LMVETSRTALDSRPPEPRTEIPNMPDGPPRTHLDQDLGLTVVGLVGIAIATVWRGHSPFSYKNR